MSVAERLCRLNLQHYLWKDQTGFLLHPDIPLDGRTELKIADVGTGTGYVVLPVIVPAYFLLQTNKYVASSVVSFV